MEIHFIWIGASHGGYLNNVGVDFSSRFSIKMEALYDAQKVNLYTLYIQENPDYIANFFEKDNIRNVTAIIGKNGSGKSSILKYIKSHLPHGLETIVKSDVFVYSWIEENVENFRILYPKEFEIDIKDVTKLFKREDYGDFLGNDHYKFKSRLGTADYIYYSYLLDHEAELDNWSGLKNISTGALLLGERSRIIQENKDPSARQSLMEAASDLDYLIGSETAKAIQFLISTKEDVIPFKKPESLYISINLTDRLFFKKDDTINFDVYEMLMYFDKVNDSCPELEKIINNLLISIFINLLIDERKYSSAIPSFTHKVNFNSNKSLEDILLNFFDNLATETRSLNINFQKYELLSLLVPEFITFIKKLFERQVLVPAGQQDGKIFKLRLDQDSENVFQKLISYYLRIKGISTFLDFKWRSLSTGEQSYLSFMSRFHHLKHHEHKKLEKNLIILIDEGDAGYHPEWQRKFFNTTLNFLSNLFYDNSVQLIFTANTPFLSSDLPKSSVIFLERNSKDRMAIIHNKENNRAATFAANIHMLFSDSFYMDGVLIGEFAKNKINKIIQYIGDEQERIPLPEYKKTIEQIGESILRTKLLSMWQNKFGLIEELGTLKLRITEIENKLRSNI